MASWIAHTWIADGLMEMGLSVDARGFVVGSIAPDKNVKKPSGLFVSGEEYDGYIQNTVRKIYADFLEKRFI